MERQFVARARPGQAIRPPQATPQATRPPQAIRPPQATRKGWPYSTRHAPTLSYI